MVRLEVQLQQIFQLTLPRYVQSFKSVAQLLGELIYVKVQFQVKPSSTGKSSCRTPKNYKHQKIVYIAINPIHL